MPSTVVMRAAEAFEDPRFVGVPQMQGSGPSTSPNHITGHGI